MSQLNDAKLLAMRTQLAAEGHANDLEHDWLVALGATAGGTLVDMWWEVFDSAAIPAGQFNDRAVAYILQVTTPPGNLGSYNNHWLFYWENATLGPPVLLPPLLGDLFHWYDFTDPLVLWQDTAGTIPIVDGQDILRVDDKGTEGTVVLDDFPPGPTWKLNLLNGLAGTLHLAGFPANLQDALWGGGSPPGPGVTIYSVGREIYSGAFPSNHYLQAGGPGVMGVVADAVSGDWAGNLTGSPQPTSSGRPITLNEWVWNKAKGGPANEFETSGSPAVVVGGPFASPPIGGTVTLGQAKGSVMEVLVYGRELTGPEEALVVAYFDAKYEVLPILPLPDLTDLVHHYDFTDNATVFRNPAKTQLAGDGDDIRVIEDKATYDPTDLTSTGGGAAAPKYRTGFINGENVADFGPSASSQPLSATATLGLSSSTSGISSAIIFRIDAGNPPAAILNAMWGSGADQLRAGRDFGAGFYENFNPGGLNVFSLAPIAQGGWYLFYSAMSGDVAADFWQLSGEAQQSAAFGPPNDIPAGDPISLSHITSQHFYIAEWAVWEGQLSASQIADLLAYADDKYGTLPTAGLPPALLNLVHWVDPSDASTVWADAAGTIPAVDGGNALRIDNKGTDGTDLTSATGTPTYRAGVLNGENVLEFSGANLQATPIFGRTISTTGYTIAMVTRRQASHIGDSILWRFTPNIPGNPGPSLRGKFSLNGNFHRADLLPDEQLIADPSVNNQWYLMYMSNDASGATDDAKFGSPGPEVAGPFGNAVDIPNGSQVRFGTSSTQVQHGEAWFWDRPLTAVERAQLVAYVDQKYGTMPHL